MIQLVKLSACLVTESNSQDSYKMSGAVVHAYGPSAEEVGTGGSPGSMACESNLLGKFQASDRSCHEEAGQYS